MIYVLEGHNCSGKSTYAESLGLPVIQRCLSTLDDIKNELAEKDNIVYDRLFGYGYMYDCNDQDLIELNEYFKTLPNVRFIKFTTTLERIRTRLEEKHKLIPNAIFPTAERVYEYFNHMFEIMDVFKELSEYGE